MGAGPCPAHRELLWQDPAPAGSPSPAGIGCSCPPGTPRLGGREEPEQWKEPVTGEGGWGSVPCPQGQPQRLWKGMVKNP